MKQKWIPGLRAILGAHILGSKVKHLVLSKDVGNVKAQGGMPSDI